MQCATIEYARSVLGLEDANSTEFSATTQNPVIALMAEQATDPRPRRHDEARLLPLRPRPRLVWPARPTAADLIHERHRHRYEFNNQYRKQFEAQRLHPHRPEPRRQPRGDHRAARRRAHPWFLAVQFHPEFKSKPTKAHPPLPRLRRRGPEEARGGQAGGRTPMIAPDEGRFGRGSGTLLRGQAAKAKTILAPIALRCALR